jgi:hypothetical protein
MEFVAHERAAITFGACSGTRHNWWVGRDVSAWSTTRARRDLTYHGLFPGVDLTYAATPAGLKATWRVAAGADARRIVWRYQGVQDVRVAADGSLEVMKGELRLVDDAPVAWQMIGGVKVDVAVSYDLATVPGCVVFALGAHDPEHDLVIDPMFRWSWMRARSRLRRTCSLISEATRTITVGPLPSTTRRFMEVARRRTRKRWWSITVSRGII